MLDSVCCWLMLPGMLWDISSCSFPLPKPSIVYLVSCVCTNSIPCGYHLSETWNKAAGPIFLSSICGKWYLFSLFVCLPRTTIQCLFPLGHCCFPDRKRTDSLDRDEKLWTNDLMTVPGKQLHRCFVWFTMAVPLPICSSDIRIIQDRYFL